MTLEAKYVRMPDSDPSAAPLFEYRMRTLGHRQDEPRYTIPYRHVPNTHMYRGKTSNGQHSEKRNYRWRKPSSLVSDPAEYVVQRWVLDGVEQPRVFLCSDLSLLGDSL